MTRPATKFNKSSHDAHLPMLFPVTNARIGNNIKYIFLVTILGSQKKQGFSKQNTPVLFLIEWCNHGLSTSHRSYLFKHSGYIFFLNLHSIAALLGQSCMVKIPFSAAYKEERTSKCDMLYKSATCIKQSRCRSPSQPGSVLA